MTVFVDNQLRGCIGYLSAVKPLGTAINELARKAATEDGRFEPVRFEDLDMLRVEITTLGEMDSFRSPADIEIGKHGVFIEKDHLRGVLLPQVAEERNWNVEQFLEAVCEKAMLPAGAWKDDGTVVKRFQAEKFSSSDSR